MQPASITAQSLRVKSAWRTVLERSAVTRSGSRTVTVEYLRTPDGLDLQRSYRITARRSGYGIHSGKIRGVIGDYGSHATIELQRRDGPSTTRSLIGAREKELLAQLERGGRHLLLSEPELERLRSSAPHVDFVAWLVLDPEAPGDLKLYAIDLRTGRGYVADDKGPDSSNRFR